MEHETTSRFAAMTETVIEAWVPVLARSLGDVTPYPTDAPAASVGPADRAERKLLLQHRLLAKSATGEPLDSLEQTAREHACHGHQVYAGVLAEAVAADAGTLALKGPSLSCMYPERWFRYSVDLDLWVPSVGSFWDVATSLTDDGWRVDGAVLVAVDGVPHVSLDLTKPCHGCDWAPLSVELLGAAFLGDPLVAQAVRALPGDDDAVQVAPVLEEAFQRRLTLRDVFDVWLLTQDEGSRQRAWDTVDAMDLWPEYLQLAQTAQRLGAPQLPAPGDLEARARRTAAHRRLRRARRLCQPASLAYLGGRAALGARSRFVRAGASRVLRAVCSPHRVFDAAFPLGGVRVDDHPAPQGLDRDGERLVLGTPLGRFICTYVPVLTARESRDIGEAPQ